MRDDSPMQVAAGRVSDLFGTRAVHCAAEEVRVEASGGRGALVRACLCEF